MNASSIKPPNFTRPKKYPAQREPYLYRGEGVISQAKCPPSRFPYISVKFGEGRKLRAGAKWMGDGESQQRRGLHFATKKICNINGLMWFSVARRHISNSRIPCLEHGQEVSVVIAHVLPKPSIIFSGGGLHVYWHDLYRPQRLV